MSFVPLYPTDDPNDDHDHITVNSWPTNRFSVDHNDRIWVRWNPIISTFGRDDTHWSYDRNLGDRRFHGTVSYNETQAIDGEGLRDIGSDSNTDLLFELVLGAINVRDNKEIVNITNSVPPLGQLDVSEIEPTAAGQFGTPIRHVGNDIGIDRDGNVYVLDTTN